MSTPGPLAAFADYLEAHREQITAKWLERVRQERRIPSSDEVPRAELIDHLPNLFDLLTRQLRAAGTIDEKNDASSAARAHGEQRWNQNYRLDELLREVSILRLVFLDHLLAFHFLHPAFVEQTGGRANVIVHLFFDSMTIDSTEQFVVRQQEELRAANAELTVRDAQRLRTLRTISHEVRNELNAISVVVMLLNRGEQMPAAKDHLDLVTRHLREITSLMDQLLEFAAILSGGEQVKLAPCDLPAMCHELALVVGEMARAKGLAFQVSQDPALPTVLSDAAKIHRIVLNLGTNAVKYTPAGGVQLAFRAGAPGEWQIEVSDTGPGIPEEERDQVFTEFHRVAANIGGQSGAGLGLAITRGLVQLLGGRIELESVVGSGTRFVVTLPIDAAS